MPRIENILGSALLTGALVLGTSARAHADELQDLSGSFDSLSGEVRSISAELKKNIQSRPRILHQERSSYAKEDATVLAETPGGLILEISGWISSYSGNGHIWNALKAIPLGRGFTLVLDLAGGDVQNTTRLISAIRAKCESNGTKTCTITTYVRAARRCESACVGLYMAGDRRLADPAAVFGFHRGPLSTASRSREILRGWGVRWWWLELRRDLFSSTEIIFLMPDQLWGSGIVHDILPEAKL